MSDVCFAWVKVVLGSKYWQCYWEEVLVELQKDAGCDYFDVEVTEERVRKNLEKSKKGCLYSLYTDCVLAKPSVSR